MSARAADDAGTADGAPGAAPPRVVVTVGLPEPLAAEVGRDLAKVGCQTRHIASAGDPFQQICSLVPAAVLVDMGGGSDRALDLCRVAKRDRRTGQVPFLFVSASPDAGLVSQVIQAGADGFLPLPAASGVLQDKLERLMERRRPSAPVASGVREDSGDERAQRIALQIRTVQELPGMPFVAAKIIETVQDAGSGATDLAQIISMDQAVSAQVLRVANSAFYGQSGKVGDISKAVVLVGFSEIANLVVTVSVMDLFRQGCRNLDPVRFWEHAVGTALVAKALARESRSASQGEAFICGLLHDIGKIALDRLLPDAYAAVLEQTAREGILVREAERRAFGEGHAFFGGILGERWGLPPGIQLAVSHHHVPQSVERLDYSHVQLVRLVCLADLLCKAAGLGWAGDVVLEEGAKRLWTLLRISRERITQVVVEAMRDLRTIREQMGLAVAPPAPARGSEPRPRVLIALEGERAVPFSPLALLPERCELVIAERWSEIEAQMDAGPAPRAIVLDTLSDPSASVLLGLLTQSPRTRAIPLVLLASKLEQVTRPPAGVVAAIARPLRTDAFRKRVREIAGLPAPDA